MAYKCSALITQLQTLRILFVLTILFGVFKIVLVFGEETDLFMPIAMNGKDEADVKSVMANVVEKFGRIDVLVNNAGYTHLATIEEMSDADTRALFDINIFGLLNVTRNVLPIMRGQKGLFRAPLQIHRVLHCRAYAGQRRSDNHQAFSGRMRRPLLLH